MRFIKDKNTIGHFAWKFLICWKQNEIWLPKLVHFNWQSGVRLIWQCPLIFWILMKYWQQYYQSKNLCDLIFICSSFLIMKIDLIDNRKEFSQTWLTVSIIHYTFLSKCVTFHFSSLQVLHLEMTIRWIKLSFGLWLHFVSF